MNIATRLPALAVIGIVGLLLSGCEKLLNNDKPDAGATAIFEELWTVIDQRYALFPAKSVDWQQVHENYRTQITNDITGKQLFDKLGRMLDELKDGHITLMSAGDTVTYDGFYSAFPANFNYNNILVNYLKNDYKTSGPLIYKVVNDIAYIYYSSFALELTDAQVDALLADIMLTKGLIFDVRHNTGGSSDNVTRLVKHFVGNRSPVKYEVTRNGTGHSDFNTPTPYYIQAAGEQYHSRVVVLTNRRSFSACNDFVLYMSQLSNITQMGDQTGGGGALPNEYILANGWKIRYSASMTLSAEKKMVEGGIAPDVLVGITPIDETNGKDPIIEKAFQFLQ